YNLFTEADGGMLARWGHHDVADLAEWFYELGHDANGQQANPQFVDFDGSDNTLDHFTKTALDDSDTGFNLIGDWTLATGDGYQGGYYVEIDGGDDEVASWTFDGLTPGDSFELFVTFPFGNFASEATYQLIDGGQVVETMTTNQRRQSPNDVTFDDTGWRRLVTFEAQSDSVTLQLLSTGGTVVADAAYVSQLANGTDPADEDFRLLTTSPAIDGGDPRSVALAEPRPSGDRINQGRYGNTSEAATSLLQTVQVLAPNGLEKYRSGDTISIDWRSSNVIDTQIIGQFNSGQPINNDRWTENPYQIEPRWVNDISQEINLDQVANAAPVEVYQTYETPATSDVDGRLRYELPVQDGEYEIRLHFAEPWVTSIGQRVFDVVLQDEQVEDDFDIVSATGGRRIATTLTLPVTATAGTGIQLDLINQTPGNPALLSGMELTRFNSDGTPNATVLLESSIDGGATWQTITTGQTLDQFGTGNYDWVPTVISNDVLVRASLESNPTVADTSTTTFQVVESGNTFFVNTANDTDFTDNEYTTAAGNNANSGRNPNQPMASV
ncbi:MAG: malectin domain-containing carbohydrate-binding protein, partial [Planctomycetota bacterium]